MKYKLKSKRGVPDGHSMRIGEEIVVFHQDVAETSSNNTVRFVKENMKAHLEVVGTEDQPVQTPSPEGYEESDLSGVAIGETVEDEPEPEPEPEPKLFKMKKAKKPKLPEKTRAHIDVKKKKGKKGK